MLVATIIAEPLMAQHGSTQLLQVVREPLKAGAEVAYASVEAETAAACAEFNCPHPHLALQPVTGPPEVWWFNLFESDTDRLRVVGEYSRNAELMKILQRNSQRKAAFTGTPIDALFERNTEFSARAALDFTGARFVVVAVAERNDSTHTMEGAVFDAADGRRLVLHPARTRDEAERIRARGGSGVTILAIRPEFGMPASDWVNADPEFWMKNPSARR